MRTCKTIVNIELFLEHIMRKYLLWHFKWQCCSSDTIGQGGSKRRWCEAPGLQLGKEWKWASVRQWQADLGLFFYIFLHSGGASLHWEKVPNRVFRVHGVESYNSNPLQSCRHQPSSARFTSTSTLGPPSMYYHVAFASIALLPKELYNKVYKACEKVQSHGWFPPVFMEPFWTPR